MQNLRKKHYIFISLLAAAALTFAGCGTTSSPRDTTQTSETKPEASVSFDTYLTDLFCSEVTIDTLTLHYTLLHPADFGIDDYDVTLGTLDTDELLADAAEAENILTVLNTYEDDELSLSQRLTKDILTDYLEQGLKSQDYYLYQEPLNPISGIQSNLPVLLAEYSFTCEQDVQDYLTLLKDIPRYFREIVDFEQKKADAGLFMADYALETVIEQCETYATLPEDNFLITTFSERLAGIADLSEESKQAYIRQNQQLLTDTFMPAFQNLADAISEQSGSGENEEGLCHLPQGKDWYTSLMQASIGTDKSPEEWMNRLEQENEKDLTRMAELLNNNDALISKLDNYEFSLTDPTDMLNDLQAAITEDFPSAPETDFSVKYVAEGLEDYLSPAFYLTTPIDNWHQNSIYINRGNAYEKLDLYTTLAHEGYPGHLYQTLMFHCSEPAYIRHLLNYPGYVEGWATYVEMISYSYADVDPALAEALQLNRALLLNLHAAADIGIHYYGWSGEDLLDFFSSYGITDQETVEEIYEMIVETPGNYLKYYAGCLEFERIKNDAMESYGSDFSETAFHDAILTIGPAPFYIIEEYLPEYMDCE